MTISSILGRMGDDVVVMELDDCQMSDNYKIREKWEEKMIRQFLVASDCFI